MSAIVFLPLSKGQVAIIDFEDLEKVGRVKWSAKESHGNWYGTRSLGPRVKQVRLWLHQEILGTGPVDHKDGDGRNNRRENLRVTTPRENMRGFRRKTPGKSSQFRGVTWYKKTGSWQAQIMTGGKNHYLGRFADELEAARAYDQAAIGLGFARESLNFP